jgi:hypothetical protein
MAPIKKKKHKRLWSVLIYTQARGKRVGEFLYVDVKDVYKEDGMLYVVTLDGMKHIHDPARIESLMIREYQKDIQWKCGGNK